MPRALTEQEKCRICRKLLDKGKDIVFQQGMKKVSVDDITKAADMAKGSFYQHFESKEKYLYALMIDVHEQIFEQAGQMLLSGGDLKATTRDFIRKLYHMPEMAFFTSNHLAINELIDTMPDQEMLSANQMETDMFEKLMLAAGIDIQKVKPGIVHNYMHALFMILSSDLMIADYLQETVELIMESLITYIFGGA